MLVELIKTIGFAILSPILVAYMTIQIAKFHFEKDMKTKYLIAKDSVANEILNSLCVMLTSMWEMVNIQNWIRQNSALQQDSNVVNRLQTARDNFHNAIRTSYLHLGKMGLYYGVEIVDLISDLQSELNGMVFNNDFTVFNNNWDEYRRNRLLPILQRVHEDLKNTVFEKTKSFHLILY